MKILYYYWTENMKDDIVDVLEKMGHLVMVIDKKMKSYDTDSEFDEYIDSILKDGYDLIFSMDYFPLLSNAAERNGLPYAAWISDCPQLTLYSKTVKNKNTYIFSFDMNQMNSLLRRGVKAFHLPLGVNSERLAKTTVDPNMNYDVTFLGSLYNNGYYELGQIKHMPETLSGYIDGIVASQLEIYGFNLIDRTFTEEKVKEMEKIARLDFGPNYEVNISDIYKQWILKKVTIEEREKLLSSVGTLFNLTLYSESDPGDIKCDYKGYASYRYEMPSVFMSSKINLNFSLRTITSGLPLRVTDVLACGGFLITNYQPELPYYFENNKSIVWFENRENLLELIDYYLKHEDERQHIQAEGTSIAREVFSYERLLKIMFGKIFKK